MAAVIFDLDQTIIDSSIAFEMRRSRNWQAVYDLIPRMHPYTGVVNLINELVHVGVKVAIVTSSPESYCKKVLKFLGITGVITVCYHDTEKHKPDPEPLLLAIKKMNVQEDEPIFAIGDEMNDVIAANRAGVISILAYWGNLYTYIKWDKQEIPFLFCRDEESLINFFATLNLNSGAIRLRKRGHNIYQLFDYYPISRVHDEFSQIIFSEVKNQDNNILICGVFCRALKESRIVSNTYGIFVVPSSTAGSWNAKLVNSVASQLVSGMGLIDCSRHILRHTTHEKQAYGGDRSVESNLRTICLQTPLPQHMRGAIIIDDITTTGNIFEACTQLLCDAGMKRENIYCVAIGGTVSF